jgi:hypothetical protein
MTSQRAFRPHPRQGDPKSFLPITPRRVRTADPNISIVDTERCDGHGASKEDEMSIGPVESLIVAFPGNQLSGDLIPALEELVNTKTVRILDIAFVEKDGNGDVTAFELEDFDSDAGRAFQRLQAEIGDLVNTDDLTAVGEELEPNSSAAILVWEDVWATRLRDAITESSGVLLDMQRVPLAVIDAALEYKQATTEGN